MMAQKRVRSSIPDIVVGSLISVLWEKTDPDTGEKLGHEWYNGTVISFNEGKKGRVNVSIQYDDGEKRSETFKKCQYGITFKLRDLRDVKDVRDDVESSEEDIDFWSIMDVNTKKIKVLEETVAELKSRIVDLEKHAPEQQDVDEGLDPDRFAALPMMEKSKYHRGGMTGVVRPIDYSEVNLKSYEMCCYYKNLDSPCANKVLKSVENIKGVQTSKYESPKAEYAPVSLLGKSWFRKTDCVTARKIAVNYSMCSACRTKVGGNVIPFPHITELCMYCRKTRACRGNLCALCDPDFTSRERGLRSVFSILSVFAPDLQVNTNKDSKGKYVDFWMTGTYQKRRFLIVIEQDEVQHSNYEAKGDNDKFAKQTAGLMHSSNTAKDGYPLVFMIRFDPDAKCRPMSGMGRLLQLYDKVECRVVLRSWVIWYLMNITEVRKCLVMYLFYDMSKRKTLFGNKFEGFGMTYHAPINPPEKDWYYCTDPGEAVQGKKYGNIINNRIEDPDKVFLEWREVDAKKAYPQELQSYLDALR